MYYYKLKNKYSKKLQSEIFLFIGQFKFLFPNIINFKGVCQYLSRNTNLRFLNFSISRTFNNWSNY